MEWEDIYIQNENEINENKNLKSENSLLKLAVIFYKENEDEENINEEENHGKNLFRQDFISENYNPFKEANNNGEKDKNLIKQSPGSPLYYKDLKIGVYSLEIIDENY